VVKSDPKAADLREVARLPQPVSLSFRICRCCRSSVSSPNGSTSSETMGSENIYQWAGRLSQVLILLAEFSGRSHTCFPRRIEPRRLYVPAPRSVEPVPEETARIAKTAFPKGTVYMTMRVKAAL